MVPTSSPRRWWILAAVLVVPIWFAPSLAAQNVDPSLGLTNPTPTPEKGEKAEDLRLQAREAEARGDWLRACWRYDDLLRRDRSNRELREAYHRCLRRLQINTRHNDRGYRDVVAGLSPSQALDVYEQVLNVVRPSFVERTKSDLTKLFKYGLVELGFALDDEAFVREHLFGVAPEAIQAFRTKLQAWPEKKLATVTAAREQINAVLRAATRSGISDRPTFAVAVTLEFASGACSGLDEYSLFFNPSQFGDIMASGRGKYAGIGIEVATRNGELEIARVHPGSPAEEAKLEPGMLVRRIDQLRTDNLPAYYAAERLRGEVGSVVELGILIGDQMEVAVKLVRRPVAVNSVDWSTLMDEKMAETDIGYLRINQFQKSTVQEVREALAQLQGTKGIKSLVLDLRGNPGGSFNTAVKVGELFLPEGSLVVMTEGTVKDFDKPFRVGGMNPFALPMVVLVDGETASAAEVLAGCLKEQGRARVMGQTTYGKGTIQITIPLDKIPLQKTPGGIRVTVAKFFWPGRSPDGGRGIVPHDLVAPDTEVLISAAREYLRTAVGMMMMPRPE